MLVELSLLHRAGVGRAVAARAGVGGAVAAMCMPFSDVKTSALGDES